MPAADPAELWARYRTSGQRCDRDLLVEHYMPLLEIVVNRNSSSVPRYVERSDLTNGAFLGLLDAIEKFDPGRGLKFTTYASSRILGAMWDSARVADWAPRSVRARERAIARTRERMEAELRRHVTNEELAAAMGIDVGDLLDGVAPLSMSHRAAYASNVAEDVGLEDVMPDHGDAPDDLAVLSSIGGGVASIIATMGERERILLGLKYAEGLSFKEIGERLGIAQSRVVQIHEDDASAAVPAGWRSGHSLIGPFIVSNDGLSFLHDRQEGRSDHLQRAWHHHGAGLGRSGFRADAG